MEGTLVPKPLGAYRNAFLSLALPLFAFSEPMAAAEFPLGLTYDSFTAWSTLDLYPFPTDQEGDDVGMGVGVEPLGVDSSHGHPAHLTLEEVLSVHYTPTLALTLALDLAAFIPTHAHPIFTWPYLHPATRC